eukprot:770905-Amphidinium_carterae.1
MDCSRRLSKLLDGLHFDTPEQKAFLQLRYAMWWGHCIVSSCRLCRPSTCHADCILNSKLHKVTKALAIRCVVRGTTSKCMKPCYKLSPKCHSPRAAVACVGGKCDADFDAAEGPA